MIQAELLKLVPDLNWIKKNYPQVRTVLFDMDGTLFDTEELHALALFTILPISIQKQLSVEILMKDFLGLPDPETFKRLEIKFLNLEMDAGQFIAKKNEACCKLIDVLVDSGQRLIFPEIITLLSDLKNNQFDLGLVTASEAQVMNSSLKMLPDNFFKLKISRNDCVLSKPHPEPYLKAMEYFKTSPDLTLIFEDSNAGFQSAFESKAHVLRVGWFGNHYFKSSLDYLKQNFL